MELYTPILVLALIAAGFAVFSVIMSSLVGPKRYNRAKLDSYECGIEPTPQALGGGAVGSTGFGIGLGAGSGGGSGSIGSGGRGTGSPGSGGGIVMNRR